MDIIQMIQDMYIPVVMIACLLVGYIMKKWIEDVDNKYIPTTLFVLGAVLACVVAHTVDVPTIVAGCASGLGATGLHQAYKQLVEKD